MPKIQKDYALTGVTINDQPARIGNSVNKFVGYSNDGNHFFQVTYTNSAETSVELVTNKRTYVLKKHPSQNYFSGVCAGIKVRVTLKKVIGTLTYWA